MQNSSQPSGDSLENGIPKVDCFWCPTHEGQYQTPLTDSVCNYDIISSECFAITASKGFIEPTHDKPTVKAPQIYAVLARIFETIVVPLSESCEHLRKLRLDEARVSLNRTFHAVSFLEKDIKRLIEQDAADTFKIESDHLRATILHAKLALVMTELAEVYTNDDDLKDLGDAMIRIHSICGGMQFSLDKAITEEMAHNVTRPHLHGKSA